MTTTVDRELLAVLVSLGPLDERVFDHIDVDRRQVDFPRMLEAGWSSGERALIEWARALWKGSGPVDLGYIAGMSDRFLAAALGGLEAYRGAPLPQPAADL